MPSPEDKPYLLATSGHPPAAPSDAARNWLQPSAEPLALERYVRVLRERWKVIVACVIAGLVGVSIYLATTSRVYEAEADLLITPISRDAELLTGLGLIRESSDPTRDVETVARLVESTSVARRAREILQTQRAPRALLNNMQAEPVAQSNIVAITARGDTAEEARQLADAFGRAIVAERSEQLNRQIGATLRRLEARRAAVDGTDRTASEGLALQTNALEALRGGPDPTVRLQNRAELPTSPVAPRPLLSLLVALIAAGLLGVVAAFALDTLDPRLRREDQLRRITRLPVLARIPKEKSRSGPLHPEQLSPGGTEAYRTLRATLSASRGEGTGPRSILVTGASASEGKTTTAINLATSLASARFRVLLIEADLRRPSIASALGVQPTFDLMDVLLAKISLEAAVMINEGETNLRLLLAKPPAVAGTTVADVLFLPTARALLDDAKRLADFVIVDSPPLTEVIDGLALAEHADEVLLVVRPGSSRVSRIAQLGELLSRHGVNPVGFAVVGAPASQFVSRYYASERAPILGGREAPLRN